MKRYKLLTSDTSDGLTELVNLALAQGWEPLGGVSVAQGGRSCLMFAQALTKMEHA